MERDVLLVGDEKANVLRQMLAANYHGIHHLPFLVHDSCQTKLETVGLQDYEILAFEPLHGVCGHTKNLYAEIPEHLHAPYADERCTGSNQEINKKETVWSIWAWNRTRCLNHTTDNASVIGKYFFRNQCNGWCKNQKFQQCWCRDIDKPIIIYLDLNNDQTSCNDLSCDKILTSPRDLGLHSEETSSDNGNLCDQSCGRITTSP